MKDRICVTFIERRKDVVMKALKPYLLALEEPMIKGSDAYMATILVTPREWNNVREALTTC